MEMTLAFGDKEMKTAVYIKMDATDQLLLSKGVCRQLSIIHYHPDAEIWRDGQHKKRLKPIQKEPKIPRVSCSVRLLKTVRLPPLHSSIAAVQTEESDACLLLEPLPSSPTSPFKIPALVETDPGGVAHVLISNPEKFPRKCLQGDELATATAAVVVKPTVHPSLHTTTTAVSPRSSVHGISTADRVNKLFTLLPKKEVSLSTSECEQLHQCLRDHHIVSLLWKTMKGEKRISYRWRFRLMMPLLRNSIYAVFHLEFETR